MGGALPKKSQSGLEAQSMDLLMLPVGIAFPAFKDVGPHSETHRIYDTKSSHKQIKERILTSISSRLCSISFLSISLASAFDSSVHGKREDCIFPSFHRAEGFF